MYSLGASEQKCALKSFRRHLEKQRREKVRDYNSVCCKWIQSGLNRVWRLAHDRNHGQ